ncbi:AAA family ATPase [Enterocloster bolteae]|uniref:AAA family ATPase n=1 Tax=Enterocloster bolteae TaxID=208479 RepID=UPI00210E0C33|nr:AAA family ATPase [Enterocloster bolteae]MCQ5145142.1 AAA family ATPase [Enterocloster bolteae]
MKYQENPVVSAVYDANSAGGKLMNPFLEAMPELMDKEVFFGKIASLPPMPYNLMELSGEERRRYLPVLQSLYYPMDYMYNIYDMLYRAVTATYTSRTTMDSIRQMNIIHEDFRGGFGNAVFSTQGDSGSILGVPGIGKTSTIRRCLGLMPQVIVHTKYKDKPFYERQITHLIVECPSDCSVKTLAFNIIEAVDRAIGSQYYENAARLRSNSASSLATQVKIICLNHHIGLLVIDEIQNAVTTAQKNKQVKPLVKLLVELTNDTNTSVYFVGTPLAEELFLSQEHLKRRTRGLRLLPLKPGGLYREFLKVIWAYQFTRKRVELTDRLANVIYDYSGGIPAYICKIFQEAQVQAILTGKEIVDEPTIMRAVKMLAIEIPKRYIKGSYISDFTDETGYEPIEDASLPEAVEGCAEYPARVVDDSTRNTKTELPACEAEEVPRLYAKPRGRKKTQRDPMDLLEILKLAKSSEAMMAALDKYNMLEVIKC